MSPARPSEGANLLSEGQARSARAAAASDSAWPALRAALDATPRPRLFFVRDDDAGWADERLVALLDVMRERQVPIDLAVIPAAIGDSLAAELARRFDAAPQLLGLHQHGWAHLNHEAAGRRCEFGAARSPAQRARDVVEGQSRLGRLFGPMRVDRFFTPPWNRCVDDLPGLLASLGFTALSRDAGATAQQALPELPVHVDWCRHWRTQRVAGAALCAIDAALAGAALEHGDAAVGLMLHHAVMDDAELSALRDLMQLLASHPRARCRPMRECLAPSAARADAR